MVRLKIGGKDYPFKFSWLALNELFKELGLSKLNELDQIEETLELEHIAKVIEIGLRHGDKDRALTIKQVNHAIDDDLSLLTRGLSAFSECISAMNESKSVGKPKPKATAN